MKNGRGPSEGGNSKNTKKMRMQGFWGGGFRSVGGV